MRTVVFDRSVLDWFVSCSLFLFLYSFCTSTVLISFLEKATFLGWIRFSLVVLLLHCNCLLSFLQLGCLASVSCNVRLVLYRAHC